MSKVSIFLMTRISSLILLILSVSSFAYSKTASFKGQPCDTCMIEFSYMPFNMDSTVYKVVPAYKFADSPVGQFLDRCVDSILAKSYDYNDAVTLVDVVNALSGPVRRSLKLSKDNPIFNYVFIYATSMDYNVIQNCVGAVITGENNIGLLYRLDERWLEELDLLPMESSVKFELQKYDPSVGRIPLLSERYVYALLRIMDNGKVDPITLTYAGDAIQLLPEIERAFDWIEGFYTEHNLPAGCEYYNQRSPVQLEWDGENFSNRTNFKPPFPKNNAKGQQ